MDAGNTSGSSSSTIVVPEKIGPESESPPPPVKRQDESVIGNFNLGVKDNDVACCSSQVSPSSLACILYEYYHVVGLFKEKKQKQKQNLTKYINNDFAGE